MRQEYFMGGDDGAAFARHIEDYNIYNPLHKVEDYQNRLLCGVIKANNNLSEEDILHNEKFWGDFCAEMERLNLTIAL